MHSVLAQVKGLMSLFPKPLDRPYEVLTSSRVSHAAYSSAWTTSSRSLSNLRERVGTATSRLWSAWRRAAAGSPRSRASRARLVWQWIV